MDEALDGVTNRKDESLLAMNGRVAGLTPGGAMGRGRRLAIMAGAATITLGVLGVYDAAAAPTTDVAEPGTVTCTGISGAITFSPPLVQAGTASEAASVKLTLSRCTVSGSGHKPATGKGTGSITDISNNCAQLALGFPDSESLAIKWAPSGKILPSEVSFPGYSAITTGGNFGFDIGGPGTSVSGSYAGSDNGATSNAEIASNKTTAQVAACRSRFKSLKITGGTFTLK